MSNKQNEAIDTEIEDYEYSNFLVKLLYEMPKESMPLLLEARSKARAEMSKVSVTVRSGIKLLGVDVGYVLDFDFTNQSNASKGGSE